MATAARIASRIGEERQWHATAKRSGTIKLAPCGRNQSDTRRICRLRPFVTEGHAVVPLQELISFLHELAPLELAEPWDNVGLLIGDSSAEISSVLTCLTLTPNVAEEAISRKAQLIVSHHPLLFRPVQ